MNYGKKSLKYLCYIAVTEKFWKTSTFFPVVIAIIIIRIRQKANTFSCSYRYNYHKNWTIKMEKTAKWLPHANKEKKKKKTYTTQKTQETRNCLVGFLMCIKNSLKRDSYLSTVSPIAVTIRLWSIKMMSAELPVFPPNFTC